MARWTGAAVLDPEIDITLDNDLPDQILDRLAILEPAANLAFRQPVEGLCGRELSPIVIARWVNRFQGNAPVHEVPRF